MKDYEIRRKDRAVDENDALEILKSGSFGAVSYTHLDVYKRQPMNRKDRL